MAQYVYTMNRVSKIVPPKREILKDISLSFFPGAKIGVLGLNGAGKSTLLRIMAGIDTDFNGEARPMADIKVGYLAQEPHLNPDKDVRGNVEEGVQEAVDALAGLEQVYADYAEPDADFDALAKEQARLEDIIQATDAHNLDHRLEVAADALRLPPWDADVNTLSGGERRRVALCRLLLSNPDMILLDIEMPRMDGYELLSSLRSHDAYRDIPVVMVTSRAGEKHRQKALDLGATDYMIKPYQDEQLLSLAESLMQEAAETATV